MDVSMRYLKAEHRFTNLHAGNHFLNGASHMCCKHMKTCQLFVGKIVDIIDLAAGNNKRVALDKRIDVEESIALEAQQ